MAGSRKVRASCFEKSLNSIFSGRYAPLASRTPGILSWLSAHNSVEGTRLLLREMYLPDSGKVRASCFEDSGNSGISRSKSHVPSGNLRASIIPSKVHASCFEKSTCRILGRYTPLASRIPGIIFWLRAPIIPAKVHASCFEKSGNSPLVSRAHHPAPLEPGEIRWCSTAARAK